MARFHDKRLWLGKHSNHHTEGSTEPAVTQDACIFARLHGIDVTFDGGDEGVGGDGSARHCGSTWGRVALDTDDIVEVPTWPSHEGRHGRAWPPR